VAVALDASEACLAALRNTLGNTVVLAGPEVPARNLSDWSGQGPVRPLAVVRPLDTAGIAAAVRIANAHRIPIVPQGGLTGLCGGAQPDTQAIALSLERLTGIEEIDSSAATMTVRAGTPLETVQRAADEAGFFCPLDLGARGSCAIGGNLSTNAGGNRVIRYGMARDMVLGLEVVLPDGTVMTSLNKMIKNNAGYDLKHLFIGSEGTLGIITRIVLRLFPKPACTMAAMCGLADFDKVLALLKAARGRLGPLLSAFEVMWPDYWNVATQKIAGVRNPLSGAHGNYVLVEAQGSDESDRGRFQGWLERLIEDEIIEDGAVAQSLADIAAFWGVRDASGEIGQFLGPHVPFDIGLPVGEMDRFASACRKALEDALPGCVALFFGHIGDGNMHIVACVPGRVPQPKAEIESIVYGLVREFGGTVSAEHGIGTLKKPWLAYARSKEEIQLMQIVKRAIDPLNLLNPGKVV
jgi:FAD/FMN-containing dehydrogenase